MNSQKSCFSSFVLLLVSFIIVCGCKKDDEIIYNIQNIENCDNFDVILVAGQSNTNSGLYYDPQKDTSDYRIMQLGRFNEDNYKIIPGKEPLQSIDNFTDRIGFSVAFAQEYISNGLLASDRKILIVHGGQGGTGFNAGYWNKGDPLYYDAVTRIKSILNSGTNNKLVVILWHQGENDCGLKDSDYQKLLDWMITNMRQDIDVDYTIPFITGGMVPAWLAYFTQYQSKQTVISETVYRLPYIGYADPMVPFELFPQVTLEGYIHYDAENQREFGKRYFNEYTKLLTRIGQGQVLLTKGN